MKMRILTSIFFLYIGSAYLFAQEAPTPSVKSAYTAGYWQQEVDYTMNIVVDAPAHQFTGEQRIVYTNNSPDVIDRVFYTCRWETLLSAGHIAKDFDATKKATKAQQHL